LHFRFESAIYNYSVNALKPLEERNNLIRKFFEEYDGSVGGAYRLINLIPKHEQPEIVTSFAEKRLLWMLENIKKGTNIATLFDENDTALFNNPDLHTYGKFDFMKTVINSECFKKPWCKEMDNFLVFCQKNGFDSGRLLSSYVEKKEASEAYVVNHNRKCGKEVIKKAIKGIFEVKHSKGRATNV
jgi:hypothetical protein